MDVPLPFFPPHTYTQLYKKVASVKKAHQRSFCKTCNVLCLTADVKKQHADHVTVGNLSSKQVSCETR